MPNDVPELDVDGDLATEYSAQVDAEGTPMPNDAPELDVDGELPRADLGTGASNITGGGEQNETLLAMEGEESGRSQKASLEKSAAATSAAAVVDTESAHAEVDPAPTGSRTSTERASSREPSAEGAPSPAVDAEPARATQSAEARPSAQASTHVGQPEIKSASTGDVPAHASTGAAPTPTAGDTVSADIDNIAAARPALTANVEATVHAGAVHPSAVASAEMAEFAADAASTLAAELTAIVETKGASSADHAEGTDDAGRIAAPSQIKIQSDAAAPRRSFDVIDVRTAPADVSAPTSTADAQTEEVAAGIQLEDVAGEVASEHGASADRAAEDAPAAVPSRTETLEARTTEGTSKPSTTAAPAGSPGGSSTSGNDTSDSDTSDPEAENPYETLAATPGEAEQSTSSGQEPQFELSPDAPIEVLDESAVQSEEPLQSIHQRIDSTASTARAAQSAAPRSSMQAAWLRAMMEQPQGALTTAAGWSSLTIKLDDTDGTMTVEARRDERHVAVQVSFSDPNLRSIAAQNIERLEAALRQQYDASVDLSLTSDGHGGGEEKQTSGSRPLHRHNAAQDSSTAVKTARSVPLGATREWVG